MSSPPSAEDIIRRYPRERLFVQPSEWTARHLDVLQCSFELQSDADGLDHVDSLTNTNRNHSRNGDGHGHGPSARTDEPVDPRPLEYWTHEAERLATSETKNAVIRHLLTERNGPFRCIRPFGFFHHGSDHKFRLHGLVFAPAQRQRQFPARNEPPVFAFLQRNMIKIQRENVYPKPNRRRSRSQPTQNIPVETMRKLQLKHLEPVDPRRDPYILAVLLGMAQAQAEENATRSAGTDSGPGRTRRGYKVCAILVDETNAEYMHFYTANISPSFLSMFNYPEQLTAMNDTTVASPLTIRFRRFPYRPYSTLRQRIVDAITTHQKG
ncbi:hypothetical protein BGZ63DRAFT_379825 [Mariannaea sp. PMI_226]|nr:hypothetical protein BGZ63DRAFT_379825 [Mariannaea sp. PMI_226]